MMKSDFMQAVRQRIENKPPDVLKSMLIELARHIPRGKYDEALLVLGRSFAEDSQDDEDLLASVRELCESAESGFYDLSYELDDEYNGGYWFENDTLVDEDGLGEEIADLLIEAMHIIRQRRYSEALQAFDGLYSITIPGGDYDDIDISTLFNNDLINLSETEVLQHYAYAALMALSGEARVKKVFEIIHSNIKLIHLRDIVQTGADEIPQGDDFLRRWIRFLLEQTPLDLEQTPRYYEEALIDAVRFSGGIKALSDFVKDHGGIYQTAYIALMKDYIAAKQYAQVIATANDGFAALKPLNINRAKIADLLLELGDALNDAQLVETATWEGFYSSAALGHFVSLYQLQNETLTGRAMRHLEAHQDVRDYYTIRFLNGDYDLVWKALKKDTNSLGWANSEKGKILPLFIALLSGANPVLPCTSKMIVSSYRNEKQCADFIQVLAESLQELSAADYQTYYTWCLAETNGRVEAIIKGKHRGSYDKASALIVSMAEIIRSRGDSSGAAKFITRYKEKYPRHSSFISCLRADIQVAKFGTLF